VRKPKGPIPETPVLPDRPDWPKVFGREGETGFALHLELGSGHGGFALAFAAANPRVNLVAIEVRKKFSDRTRARAAQRGLTNLMALRADARVEVPRLFAEESLGAIYLHFPDPWWKRRHEKRRLVAEGFAELLLGRLVPGGLLDVRTDVRDRANEMAAILEEAGFANEAGPRAFSPRPEGEIPSTREKRYLTAAEPVYRLRLRRPPQRGG
jgi:tRNA (guanine-N7-)-methyltransferase